MAKFLSILSLLIAALVALSASAFAPNPTFGEWKCVGHMLSAIKRAWNGSPPGYAIESSCDSLLGFSGVMSSFSTRVLSRLRSSSA